MDRCVAFIPARGGSKAIPGKNWRSFAGKPLIRWTVEAALDCPLIAHVYVSTDSNAIASAATSPPHPRLTVLQRSAETATDTASTESALLEFAQHVDFDFVVLIQPTSPLLSAQDLTGGIQRLREAHADSILSVVRQQRFLWRPQGELVVAINYDPQQRPRRQQFDGGFLVENGAFYITSRQLLLRSRCRISGKVAGYEMPSYTYLEIDDPDDWAAAEALLLRRRGGLVSGPALPMKSLRLFACDVDGVLTDGGMYYTEQGEEAKRFNTRDGKGLELLRNAGIVTALITSEKTRLVERRAAKLRVDHLLQGVADKGPALLDLCGRMNIEPAQAAYMGDDLNDLEALSLAGFSACPADAVDAVRQRATYHCRLRGGEGCVREVCDLILELRRD